jgi:gliding motility-associated-like protein
MNRISIKGHSCKMKCVVKMILSNIGFTIWTFSFGIIAFAGYGRDLAPHSNNVSRVFVENKGQWADEIKFRMEIHNGFIFFRDNGITYFFHENLASPSHSHDSRPKSNLSSHNEDGNIDCHSVKLEYKNCNLKNSKLRGINGSQEYFNYFLGKDFKMWASKVKSYSEVYYDNIYPGISIKFYLKNGNLKYDVLVDANADLSPLAFKISGQDQLIQDSGNLLIQTSIQDISEQNPFSYQEIGGRKIEVKSSFNVDNGEINFEFLNGYDKTKPLVIDPKLVFSTFSGVTADNWGFTASFDSKGNTYSGGIASVQFGGNIIPPVGSFQQSYGGGSWDMAIFKYDSTGSKLLYGTYLGGNDTDVPHSLVTNSKDELLIFGTTGSNDFPTSRNAIGRLFKGGSSIIPIPGIPYTNGSDIIVTRISEDGTEILSSTYLGGSGNDGLSSLFEFSDPLIKNYGDQVRGDIITDLEDNVYLATSTMSVDFELNNSLFPFFSGGIRDAVLLKLNSDLSQMEWGTYVGGSGEDAAFSVKLDANNNVLIAGATNSSDLPVGADGFISTFNGGIDGFVNYFDTDGTNLISGTFVGTPQDDLVYFSDFDSEGNVYLLGQSNGNYPITNGIYSNPNSQQFIHKLSSDLSTSIFSTQFGSGQGRQDISTTAFLVNECDNLFVAGWGSGGSDFGVDAGYNGMNTLGLPITQNGFQTGTSGNDFYLAVFNANMENLLYATYMGGTTAAPHVDGGTSRFDKRGVVYQSVCSCGGESDDFPTTDQSWSTTNNSFPSTNGNGGSSPRCNNAVFKFDLATIVAGIQTNTIEGDNPGIREVCLPAPILFTNVSLGGEKIEWDFGDGTRSLNKDSIVHYYESAGTYKVTLRIEDQNTCRAIDFAYTTIEVFDYDISVVSDGSICQGTAFQLNATGAANYVWTLADVATSLNGFEPSVKPDANTKYYLTATTSDGCVVKDSVFVEVNPSYLLDFDIEKEYFCSGLPLLKLINKSTIEDGLTWDFGDGQIEKTLEAFHFYDKSGEYTIELSHDTNTCTPSKIETINIEEIFVPNAFSPNHDLYNEYFKINGPNKTELSIVNRLGKEVFHSSEYQNDWDASDVPGGIYYYVLTLDEESQCNGWVQVFK